jgi:hypothetical protein
MDDLIERYRTDPVLSSIVGALCVEATEHVHGRYEFFIMTAARDFFLLGSAMVLHPSKAKANLNTLAYMFAFQADGSAIYTGSMHQSFQGDLVKRTLAARDYILLTAPEGLAPPVVDDTGEVTGYGPWLEAWKREEIRLVQFLEGAMSPEEQTITRLREERGRLRNEVVALRGDVDHDYTMLERDLGLTTLYQCQRCGKETSAPTHTYFDSCA